MKNYISSALKRYNANSRNTYTGDCVRRALSLAYGIDYDKVSAELNRMKRERGYENTKKFPIITAFLNAHGATRMKSTELEGIHTVGEFCEAYPTGTYILATNDKDSSVQANHLVCIIDGDAYDTWDSITSKIYNAWIITSEATQMFAPKIENILPQLDVFAEQYFMKVEQEYDFATFHVKELNKINEFTGTMNFACRFDDEVLPEYSRYYGREYPLYYEITIKLTPKWTEEENLESLKPKLKQKLYDWIYSIRTSIKDDAVAKHPNFIGNENILRQLPRDVRPYVRRVDKWQGWYDIVLDIMPQDQYPERGRYSLELDDFNELKSLLNEYAKTGNRLGYEV